jgi:hypothetical protein
MVLRWWDNRVGKVIIGSLPDSKDMLHQVRRETLAGTLALEAAALEIDLSDAVVVLRNDAVGALTALRKGSFASTFLQKCAMRTCRLQRRIGCNALYLHAPGLTLVEEGVDDLSRAGALDVAGPMPARPALRFSVNKCCVWPGPSVGQSPSMLSLPSPTPVSLASSHAMLSHALKPRTLSRSLTGRFLAAHTALSSTARPSSPIPLPPSSTPSSPRPAPTARAPSSLPRSPSPLPRGTSSSAPLFSTTAWGTSASVSNTPLRMRTSLARGPRGALVRTRSLLSWT